MIIADTNVISEVWKRSPDPKFLSWWSQVSDSIATTSVTVGELHTGIKLLPPSQRRDFYARAFERSFSIFEKRNGILPYDLAAARALGEIVATRRSAGRPISAEDAMIAAICRSRRLTLATRNTKDFEGTGVRVINPWQ